MNFIQINFKIMLVSYVYKELCADDKFSKSFGSNLSQDVLHTFIMIVIKVLNIAVMRWKSILIDQLLWPKIMMKILTALQNVGFIIILLLTMILKYEIIVTSVKIIEVLDTELLISTSVFTIKFPSSFTIWKNITHMLLCKNTKFWFLELKLGLK